MCVCNCIYIMKDVDGRLRFESAGKCNNLERVSGVHKESSYMMGQT